MLHLQDGCLYPWELMNDLKIETHFRGLISLKIVSTCSSWNETRILKKKYSFAYLWYIGLVTEK